MNVPPPLSDGPPPLLPGAETGPPPAPRRFRWWIHLALLSAYPIVLGVISGTRSLGREAALGTDARRLLLACAVELGVFAFVFGLAWLASRATAEDLRLRWRGGFWTLPLGIGYSVVLRLGVAMLALVAVAVALVTRVLTVNGLQDFILRNRPDVGAVVDVSALRSNPLYFWLTLTLVSFVLGGLREEIWRSGVLAGMRRLWPRHFGSTIGQLVSVALVAVAFGLGHLAQGPLAVGLTAALGVGLGAIIVLHRSIWPAVIAHGMFDATSLALLPWVMEQIPQIKS